MGQTNSYLCLYPKLFLFLVFIFQNNVFLAQSDSTITVELKKVEGFGALPKSFKIIHKLKDCSHYFGIPNDVEISSCFYFSMHSDQELFEKIKNSEPLSRRNIIGFFNKILVF